MKRNKKIFNILSMIALTTLSSTSMTFASNSVVDTTVYPKSVYNVENCEIAFLSCDGEQAGCELQFTDCLANVIANPSVEEQIDNQLKPEIVPLDSSAHGDFTVVQTGSQVELELNDVKVNAIVDQDYIKIPFNTIGEILQVADGVSDNTVDLVLEIIISGKPVQVKLGTILEDAGFLFYMEDGFIIGSSYNSTEEANGETFENSIDKLPIEPVAYIVEEDRLSIVINEVSLNSSSNLTDVINQNSVLGLNADVYKSFYENVFIDTESRVDDIIYQKQELVYKLIQNSDLDSSYANKPTEEDIEKMVIALSDERVFKYATYTNSSWLGVYPHETNIKVLEFDLTKLEGVTIDTDSLGYTHTVLYGGSSVINDFNNKYFKEVYITENNNTSLFRQDKNYVVPEDSLGTFDIKYLKNIEYNEITKSVLDKLDIYNS